MNQATLVLTDGASFRCTLNELPAMFGIADRTHARPGPATRWPAPGWPASVPPGSWWPRGPGDDGEEAASAERRFPVKLAVSLACKAVPPTVFSASTLTPPAVVAWPCTPFPEVAVPRPDCPALLT